MTKIPAHSTSSAALIEKNDFSKDLEFVIRWFEGNVKDAEKARETMVNYIQGPGGIAQALEWASSHVVTDEKGRAAQQIIDQLENAFNVDDVATVAERTAKKARAELSYLSLGNSQMFLTGKIAFAQALSEAASFLQGFVDSRREREAK